MKLNVLIFGFFGQFGGREIEVRNLIVALSEKYNVRVISMGHMSNDSVAIKNLNCVSTSIFKELYRSSLGLRITSFFSKMHNSSKLPTYFFIENTISKKLFSFYDKKSFLLESEIKKTDIVLYCGVLESTFLGDMIEYCNETRKPIILRTTGTVATINNKIGKLLPKVVSVIAHSKSNTRALLNFTNNNIDIVDQTTLVENKLLHISILKKEKLTFGYLGRFSREKGIVELLRIFSKLDAKLFIAGSGPLLEEVENEMTYNCSFLGEIEPENLAAFFSEIDVLIIPSHEEAGPLVGIEAMAAGKIIFSTKVGAMEERLKGTKNNFWFDISSESSFLALVARLHNMNSDEIVAIQQANRKRYLEKYSIENISNQYLEIFEKAKDSNS
ncbi:hypothetical protein FFWV33_07875 [Flavobacterium faecale]|uniref:Glycosyl transferase family 1 domain-containing protein n=1 Tax=Flavobacterium faecale TaxID=1355330 RepID=A0A2S1LCN1_9FLAO|nr:glycosyltransferase family 4 protein [Flavobacterium faecale]AWG21457.1 hypothetical protein FFWV33_07875 [Flavobacterium faecale]